MAADERLRIVDEFQNDPDKFIFLVSTLAGGVGLNLSASPTFDGDGNVV